MHVYTSMFRLWSSQIKSRQVKTFFFLLVQAEEFFSPDSLVLPQFARRRGTSTRGTPYHPCGYAGVQTDSRVDWGSAGWLILPRGSQGFYLFNMFSNHIEAKHCIYVKFSHKSLIWNHILPYLCIYVKFCNEFLFGIIHFIISAFM